MCLVSRYFPSRLVCLGVSSQLNGLADGKLGVTMGALAALTVVWLVSVARTRGPLTCGASDEGVNRVFSPGLVTYFPVADGSSGTRRNRG